MSKNLLKALPELIEAGVVSTETADAIRYYYQQKTGSTDSRLYTVFGILGALLIGLGIILIVAHNWDSLSRPIKTVLAFMPLLVGQVIGAYTLIRKPENIAWKEGSATFIFFAVATAISLVGQIYNIPGKISSFLITWMLLTIPLIYLFRSSMVSLLCIVGITYYGWEVGYWRRSVAPSPMYWVLLASIIPHYINLLRHTPKSNFLSFHNWFLPTSLLIILGTVSHFFSEYLFVAYCSLLGLFYLIGSSKTFEASRRFNNGFLMLGSVGTIVLLLWTSFLWIWEDVEQSREHIFVAEALSSPEFIVMLFLSIAAITWAIRKNIGKQLPDINPIEFISLLFIPIFLLGFFQPFLAMVLINILTFLAGLAYVRRGTQLDHLVILNYGLLIITALITCRFFDTNLSFIARGLLFVAIGASFFFVNHSMLKKRRLENQINL